MKKNTNKLIGSIGILVIILILAFPFIIRGRRMENRLAHDTQLFQQVAEKLCDVHEAEDWPVWITKTDMEEKCVEYALSRSDIIAISRIFFETNCVSIFASRTRNNELYCEFTDISGETETGIIFIPGMKRDVGEDAESLARKFSGVDVIQTAYYITDHWIYYEGFILD